MDRRTLLAFIIDATSQPQLDTPTNLTASGTTITFDEVENATSYEVFADGVSIGEYEVQTGETWVINENTDPRTLGSITTDLISINFTVSESGVDKEQTSIQFISQAFGTSTFFGIQGTNTSGTIPTKSNILFYNSSSTPTSIYWYVGRTWVFATAPTGDLLTWLQANATLQPSTETVTIDLTTLTGWESLSSGAHTITVKAKADGYKDSLASQGVSVTKPSSGHTLTFDNSYEVNDFNVNGVKVSSPYNLQNGDVIESGACFIFGGTGGYVEVNGVRYTQNTELTLSNTDIEIVVSEGRKPTTKTLIINYTE